MRSGQVPDEFTVSITHCNDALDNDSSEALPGTANNLLHRFICVFHVLPPFPDVLREIDVEKLEEQRSTWLIDQFLNSAGSPYFPNLELSA